LVTVAEHVLINYDPRKAGLIVLERLEVNALGAAQVQDPVVGMEKGEPLPNEIIEFRQSLRSPISEALVDEELDINELIVPGTVRAAYEGSDPIGKDQRYADSWDNDYFIHEIDSAISFARVAINHVLTNGLYGRGQLKTKSLMPGQEFCTAYIKLRMDADLPLNGYEGKEFLKDYIVVMKERASRLIRLFEADRPEEKELHVLELDKIRGAITNAKELLDWLT
jgi:hypothetical protein